MHKLILDCDPGMDDSMAIAMAALSDKIELLGVVTCHGNYPVDVTTTNALKIVEMLGVEVPVAKGCAAPLFRPNPADPFSHGSDGQAENFLPTPVQKPDTRHGSQFIIDKVNEFPGEVTIAVTGPMSNLALALQLDPEIRKKIKKVVAISGAFGLNPYSFVNATGDNPQSEWNVFVDPEAAKLVYEAGLPLVAIGLDVATHFDVNFSDDDTDAFNRSAFPAANFLGKAIEFVTKRGYDAYCTIIDCMAIAVVENPALIETMSGRVGIETESRLCRGMTVLDRRHHHVWDDLPLIEIATSADYERFLNRVKELLLQEGKSDETYF